MCVCRQNQDIRSNANNLLLHTNQNVIVHINQATGTTSLSPSRNVHDPVIQPNTNLPTIHEESSELEGSNNDHQSHEERDRTNHYSNRSFLVTKEYAESSPNILKSDVGHNSLLKWMDVGARLVFVLFVICMSIKMHQQMQDLNEEIEKTNHYASSSRQTRRRMRVQYEFLKNTDIII